MSYLVLARKWRPQTFEAVLGQEHITRVLVNAIKSRRLAHSFLFSGPRGVGKTSTARILAKAINCDSGPTPTPCNKCTLCREITSGNSPSIIEIDGASNNSVEDIRALREKVGMIPTSGRYKIYIIDEVHMLSTAAFNALLKTLEEPPAHVKFIFATTEIHKIPPTILSRCQRFDFKRIAPGRIVENIQQILDKEGITTNSGVLSLIAKASEGSMRDALSILDQILSSSGAEISESEVEALLGLVGTEQVRAMAGAIAKGDAGAALGRLSAVLSIGGTLEIYWRQLMEYFRDGLFIRIAAGEVDLSEEETASVKDVFSGLADEDLIRILKSMAEGFDRIRLSQQPQVIAETILLKLCDRRSYVKLEEIVEKLQHLEKGLGGSCGPPLPMSGPVHSGATAQVARPVTKPQEKSSPEVASEDAQGTTDTKALYDTLIKRINSVNKALAAFLSQGRIVGFSAEEVVLGFEKGVGSVVNMPKYINIIREELENILKQPVKVAISKEDLPSGKSKVSGKPVLKKEEREAVENNPAFKMISEMFDTKLVNIQKVVS